MNIPPNVIPIRPKTSEQEPVDENRAQGLSPWASGPPPSAGWWKTRRKSSPTLNQPQRRWWRADLKKWSLPVQQGESDETTASLKNFLSDYTTDDIEWCGLLEPRLE